MNNKKFIKEKRIKLRRDLFRLADKTYIAINATDYEIEILYDMQNKAIKLYNCSVDIDKRIKKIEEEILKRSPFRKI